MSTSWLLLQLVDAAFPAGGFAHSAGLEATLRFRGVSDIEPFVDEVLWQSGRSSLPFVRRGCEVPSELATLDALFDASTTSHVANRASRAQGRAFASAASRIFDGDSQGGRIAHIGRYAATEGPAHHAPIFGSVFGVLGISSSDTQTAWLHGVLRGVLSAAVRLGILGPLEAQQVHSSRAALLSRVLTSCLDTEPGDASQPSPLVELYGTLHDQLDGRLFQS